jgi:hypothetical protein
MKKYAIAAALALFLTPAAFAGAYVGASVGQSDASASDGATSIDGDDSSWKIVGGYTFMKFVGIEGSYRNFGGIDDAVGTTTFLTDASSLDVFGMGILPLGKIKLFAKAGYARIDFEATIDDPLFVTPIAVSDTQTELAYGAGLSFGLGIADVRFEYETFDASEDLNMFSVGAVFKF